MDRDRFPEVDGVVQIVPLDVFLFGILIML